MRSIKSDQQLDSVGEVIASRRLRRLRDGVASEVTVLIGKPQPFEDGGGHYCPYQIVGVGSQAVRWVAGVDAVQALILVAHMIGTELWSYVHRDGEMLRWGDTDNDELGFPLWGDEPNDHKEM